MREKKPIAPKQVREKDISGLLIKVKQCGKLASKASQSRVGGEDSHSSLARELWWRQYQVRVFREGIEILEIRMALYWGGWLPVWSYTGIKNGPKLFKCVA